MRDGAVPAVVVRAVGHWRVEQARWSTTKHWGIIILPQQAHPGGRGQGLGWGLGAWRHLVDVRGGEAAGAEVARCQQQCAAAQPNHPNPQLTTPRLACVPPPPKHTPQGWTEGRQHPQPTSVAPELRGSWGWGWGGSSLGGGGSLGGGWGGCGGGGSAHSVLIHSVWRELRGCEAVERALLTPDGEQPRRQAPDHHQIPSRNGKQAAHADQPTPAASRRSRGSTGAGPRLAWGQRT